MTKLLWRIFRQFILACIEMHTFYPFQSVATATIKRVYRLSTHESALIFTKVNQEQR